MNKPLLIAIGIAAFGAGAIAIVAGSGSGDDAQPVSIGMTRPNLDPNSTTTTNNGLKMLSDSRASLRTVNRGTSFSNYQGPLAAETPDRYDESLEQIDTRTESDKATQINQPRRVTPNNRADQNPDADRAQADQNRTIRPAPRAGARGGSGPAGVAPNSPLVPSNPMPGGDGPTGPDLSMLPDGLIIPDGLPQSVIDVLIDAANRGVFQNGGGGSTGGGGGGGSTIGGGGNSGGGGGGIGGGGGGGGGTVIGGGGAGGAGGPEAQLVWVSVPISGCSELVGQRTRDLYVRLTSPSRVLSADSGVTSAGLTITGAGFTQVSHSFSSPHTPPSDFEIQQNPCVAYDTYLAFGSSSPGVLGGTPIYEPTLNAQWFGILVEAQQNTSLFNDNAYYLRLGRFTAPRDQATIGGEIRVSTARSGGGGTPVPRMLSVPSWTEPNGGLDNGSDGGDPLGGGGGDGNDEDDGDDSGNGDGGGDDGDDPGGGGGGGNDDEDDTPVGDPEAITLVWHQVDNNGCSADTDGDSVVDFDLSGTLTYDLLMRSPTPDRVVAVSTGSDGSNPFSVILGDPVIQYPGPENSNTLPTASDIAAQPCLAFDTFFAIGTSPDIMFITGEPDPEDWPLFVTAEWATDAIVIAQQDSSTYGDSAYYTRLMRVTIPGPSTIIGDFRLTVIPSGTSGAVNTLPLSVPVLP